MLLHLMLYILEKFFSEIKKINGDNLNYEPTTLGAMSDINIESTIIYICSTKDCINICNEFGVSYELEPLEVEYYLCCINCNT